MTNEFFEEEKQTEIRHAHKEKRRHSSGLPKTKKAKKIVAVIAVASLVLAGVIFFSAEWALDALVHSRAEKPVPDITKKSASNALDLLAASNFAMKKAGEELAAEIPAGFIVRQEPSAGKIAREGRVILVWVSEGVQVIQMPNLVGLSLADARLALRSAGLEMGTTSTVFSLTHAKGIVAAQSFPEDTPINKGDIVNLTVSNGAPEASILLMPDFRRKKLTDAALWASQNNVELEVIDEPESNFPNGTVTAQNPAPDMQIESRSVVTVSVSRRNVEGEARVNRIHYELPQGKNSSTVRIVLTDDSGERDVLNELRAPGSKIDIEVPYGGEAKYRIYVNNILVRERELK